MARLCCSSIRFIMVRLYRIDHYFAPAGRLFKKTPSYSRSRRSDRSDEAGASAGFGRARARTLVVSTCLGGSARSRGIRSKPASISRNSSTSGRPPTQACPKSRMPGSDWPDRWAVNPWRGLRRGWAQSEHNFPRGPQKILFSSQLAG